MLNSVNSLVIAFVRLLIARHMSPIGHQADLLRSRRTSAIRGGTDLALTQPEVRVCEGLRMPVLCWWRGGHRSRRPQTSKGGNRGTFGEVLRQTLWGFRSWGCVAEVR